MDSLLGACTALLVTAHPDDEAMFFSPLVLHLTAVQETRVALLCLSTGAWAGGVDRSVAAVLCVPICGLASGHGQ